MTAEQLNIKMNLDIGDLLSDVKRIKTQLNDMAASIKNSIPRIGSESKNASGALAGVARASKNVKESLEDIGDEAKDSLSDVTRYSKTAASALKSMKDASNGTTLGFNTDEIAEDTDDINSSFEAMQGTMQAIMGLNIWQAMSGPLSKFKKQMQGVKDLLPNFKKAFSEVFSEEDGWGLTWTWDELKSDFRKALDTMKVDAKKGVAGLKECFSNLKYDIGEVFETDGWKNFKANITACTKAVAGLVLKVLALAAALSAVAVTIATIKVSELGKEVYNNAQRCGMSAQAYQEWAYVLQRAGIEADELKEIVKTLTEAQIDVINSSEDTINAFAQLGLSAEEVAGMSQQQLWNETIKRLQNVGNVTQRTAIAYKLFGEDASKLTTILNLSNEQTQGLIDTYNRLGGVMSKELLVNSQVLQGSLANLKVAWSGLCNTIAQAVIPIVIALVDWLTTAIAAVNAFLQVFFGLDLSPALDSLAGGFTDGTGAVGDYTDALEGAAGAAEKLKRVTMGFDELNIVTDPATSSGGGGGGGTDTGVQLPDMSGATSIFQEVSKQAEEFKVKMQGFFDEFKTQIAIIGTALGALGISKLLGHLGEALGLGDKFMGFVNGVAKLATSAIVITLQYTLTNEFFDNFIDGEGIKNYLLGLLVSAIGTGVLYSMWGPTGAVIGLLVTAVAGIKAVIDNEGITNGESATVMLTSLGAAIAALGIAWKKLGLATWVAGIKEWLAAAKLMAPEVGKFAAYFPKLSTAISSIGGALSSAVSAIGAFAGSIGSALGLSGAAAVAAGAALIVAAIAAIVGAIMFCVNHWNELVQAVKDFWADNIVPKFESIGESLSKIGDALSGLWNALPQGLKDFFTGIANAIRDIVVAIGEWIASIDWLEGIKVAFEFLGMIVVDILGGAIMGAINALVGAIDGLVQFISGAVQIIAGLVEAIVKLFSGDLQGAWEAVKKIGNGILDCFIGLYKATIGVIVDFVKGIIDWFVEMWDVLVGHSIVPDTVEAIIEWFGKMVRTVIDAIANFVKKIIDFFSNLFKNVVGAVTNFVETVVNWFGDLFSTIGAATAAFVGSTIEWFASMIGTVVEAVTNFVGSIISWFGNLFDNVGTIVGNLFDTVTGWFSKLFDGVVETVTSMVDTVVEWFTDLGNSISKLVMGFVNIVINQFKKLKEDAIAKFKAIVEFIKQAWSNVKNVWDVAATWFGNVWTGIKNVFSNTANWFKDIFQKAWNGITGIFNAAKNYFTGVWNTIKDIFSNVGTAIANGISGAVKGAINSVLSAAVGKINTFIGWINGAIGIINKIPGVSIGYLGYMSVPQLAKGGIVTSETLARIGEGGKREAVLPLEQNTGWMDMLADKIAARNNNTTNTQPTKIVLQVGETELGWATINSINGITKQQGGLQLHLV